MKYLLLFCCALICTTCADPVLPSFQLETGLYLIEGSIVDQPGESEVRVSISELSLGRYVLVPVRDALVVSTDETGMEVTWTLNGSGYAPPAEFAAEQGRTYTLRVTTADGTVLESQPETVPTSASLIDARLRFEQEGFFSQTLNGFVPTIFLDVDLADPAGERNYYQLRYRKWERRLTCASCPRMFRYRNGECQEWRGNRAERWDYLCDGQCWTIKNGTEQALFRDEFSDGNTVTNIEVAREIYYSRTGGILFEARLLGISKEAFLYNQVFNEQAQGGGGLNAVNPTALVGNMYNVANDKDIILGFVNAASVSTRRIYTDRSDILLDPLPDPLPVILEPTPSTCTGLECPPRVACEGENTTSEEPEGWGG